MKLTKIKLDDKLLKKNIFRKYDKEVKKVHVLLETLKNDEVLEIKNIDISFVNTIRGSIKPSSYFSRKTNNRFTTRYINNNLYIKIR